MADLLPRPFGNPLGGIIGNELRYMGNVLSQGRLPYIAPNETLGPRIGRIPPSANGESYRRAELRLADAARAGGGGGGGGNAGYSVSSFRPIGGTPEERAQAAETSRIAQLTAQDPDLQRYEKASKAAKTQEEMDAARDIGMAIWARANPKLAAKVKPGQSGYEVIQNELNAGQMGPVTDLPFDSTKPFSPTPIPPEQLNVTYQGASPVPIPGAQPIAPTAFGRPEMQFFETFRQAIAPGPQFKGSPLAIAPETVVTAYKAELLSPLGGPLPDGAFRSDKARQMAEFYKKAQLGQ